MERQTALDSNELAVLLPKVCDLAKKAGDAIMEIYEKGFMVKMKDDHTPVTDADELSQKIINEGLKEITPDIKIIGEEMPEVQSLAFNRRAIASDILSEDKNAPFWLVDPIDGTKEFVRKNGEFTVNIALIQNRRPVLGVVYVPNLDELYFAAAPGKAYFSQNGKTEEISARYFPDNGVDMLISRSHNDTDELTAFISQLPMKVNNTRESGSSRKFCLIARGQADIYPRFTQTMEWDIAAAHAVLLAAGGRIIELNNGQSVFYAKPSFFNAKFLAMGRGVKPDDK